MTFNFRGNIIKVPKNLSNPIKSVLIPNNLKVLIFGGALDSNCYRDKLIKFFKKENLFLTIIPDKINYFDIASEHYNLIEKETRLFENSDVLIVIPESAGSFAEIGMIASMISNPHDKIDKSKYAKKVLIVLNKKYKHDESFLKLGPIKSIKHFGGKTINVDFESDNFNIIVKKLNDMKSETEKIYHIDNRAYCSLFFSNSIKILLYIYQHKTIKFHEQEYKSLFIDKLKTIHIAITIDNIEYLESIELIKKENVDGEIIINVNFNHSFVERLININLKSFQKNKLMSHLQIPTKV